MTGATKPLTVVAHEAVARRLESGDRAIDATAGNGHDTCFLARSVGPEGEVVAIDVQATAIASTRSKLESEGLLDRVRLVEGDHSQLRDLVPEKWSGTTRAILFNLGFLPGSDKTVITRPETTMMALETSLGLLAPNGILSVLVYPGHEGGEEEATRVREWATNLRDRYDVTRAESQGDGERSPELWLVTRSE